MIHFRSLSQHLTCYIKQRFAIAVFFLVSTECDGLMYDHYTTKSDRVNRMLNKIVAVSCLHIET